MMKLSSLLLLLLVNSSFGSEWETLDELETTFKEYSTSAKRILTSAERSIAGIRVQARDFLDGFAQKFNTYSRAANSRKCAKSTLNFEELESSFLSEISRSEMPLLTHISELKERLGAINSSISIHLSLADSKFWSCRLHNDSCTEEINSWLEEVVSKIACKLSKQCKDDKDDKRMARSIRRKVCSQTEFTCRDGSCIKKKWACDGEDDCKDESDEPQGCTRVCTDGFHCTSTLRCIPRSMVCDGRDDCGDFSDERNCSREKKLEEIPTANCTAARGFHRCDEKCINLDLVCDDHRDCIDGSDEGSLCGRGICPLECTRKGGLCFLGPLGPICLPECPLGMYESATGCSSKPQHPETNVMELLEEIPVLTARHNSRFSKLKAKTISTVTKALVDLVRCDRKMFGN